MPPADPPATGGLRSLLAAGTPPAPPGPPPTAFWRQELAPCTYLAAETPGPRRPPPAGHPAHPLDRPLFGGREWRYAPDSAAEAPVGDRRPRRPPLPAPPGSGGRHWRSARSQDEPSCWLRGAAPAVILLPVSPASRPATRRSARSSTLSGGVPQSGGSVCAVRALVGVGCAGDVVDRRVRRRPRSSRGGGDELCPRCGAKGRARSPRGRSGRDAGTLRGRLGRRDPRRARCGGGAWLSTSRVPRGRRSSRRRRLGGAGRRAHRAGLRAACQSHDTGGSERPGQHRSAG